MVTFLSLLKSLKPANFQYGYLVVRVVNDTPNVLAFSRFYKVALNVYSQYFFSVEGASYYLLDILEQKIVCHAVYSEKVLS